VACAARIFSDDGKKTTAENAKGAETQQLGIPPSVFSVFSVVLKSRRIWCDGLVDEHEFSKRLRAWFRRQGRDLPWRRTRDPYAILVSEMMLQQTTVAAVIPYYERWMKRFPSVQELAAAEESEVLALWQGLGYYRRARNLHAAAKKLDERAGVFPRDYKGLRDLPGIGDYTAQAVRAFAFDEPVPVLDANVIRVVARLFEIRTPVDTAKGLAKVRAKLEELLPAKGGHEFVSAIMELGALVCRAGRPDCLLCPVREFCTAKSPEKLPVKSPKAPVKERAEYAAWVSDGKWILLQQSTARRWGGLWRLPPLETEPRGGPAAELTYSIVRERVTLRIHRASERALAASDEPRKAFLFRELEQIAIPSPHRRAIAKARGE
jgi:A/G-specific adenine glycosylase